ncbi:cleavage factor CFIM-25 protein [Trifolium repens]|nr:cleavage factor CFIM-25 protein [Trifolium repens]
MKTTVEVILFVHEHINSRILLLKHAESYYMLQGGCLKPGETEIEGLERKLTSKLGSTPDFKIQLTVKAKLTLAKIDTADLVHEEIHPHLLLLKIAGSYFLLPEIENLKRKLTSMLGPTKPEFMPNWQGNQNSPVTILLAIKDVFSMIQHTLVDKKLAFLCTKFTLMSIIILKNKYSYQKLRRKQIKKFKRESKAKKLSQIPSKKAILIGMTYENLKNNKVLVVTKSSAIEVDDLKNILLKHYDFPMENALVMTDKLKNHLHITTKENINER